MMKYLVADYDITRDIFKDDFKDCSDFLLREVKINGERAFFAVMDGLVDSIQLSQMVTKPILSSKLDFDSPQEHFALIKDCVVGSVEMNEAQTFDDCYYFLMSGFALFFLDGSSKALALGIQGWTKRSTDEPSNESMVKGAKECFIEAVNDNKALLRKRLKTPHLKLKQIKLGNAAQTPVVIAYIDNRADSSLVAEIEQRLKAANLNTVLDYGCLDPFIDTDIGSFFSSVGNTERPDVFASKLLEGRVGVMVEGTPFAMYTPYLFSDNFSSLDDYDNPPFYSSFMRGLKYFSFILSLFLPGLYVAVGTFHQEVIPTTLLYVVATSEATTPFPLMLEAIMIHILYEIMREAGLRLPKTIGHAVSIIGAIVIGEATVSAGIIGAPMLVVVAVTAIASYVVYPLYESVAVLRILFIIVGGTTGIYGLMLCAGLLFVNICAINPYGVPYSAPISPLTKKSLGDTIFREGWKKLARRRVRVADLEGSTVNDK
ncbi:MAG: spore germination protein [Eubacterium sp.]